MNHIDLVARIETAAQFGLALHHRLGDTQQMLVVVLTNLVGLGQLLHCMAQRLAGDGAAMGAVAAGQVKVIDDSDVLALLGALHGRALAAGACADHDDIVPFSVHAGPCRSLAKSSSTCR